MRCIHVLLFGGVFNFSGIFLLSNLEELNEKENLADDDHKYVINFYYLIRRFEF